MCVCVCVYPRTVTHPSTNRARRSNCVYQDQRVTTKSSSYLNISIQLALAGPVHIPRLSRAFLRHCLSVSACCILHNYLRRGRNVCFSDSICYWCMFKCLFIIPRRPPVGETGGYSDGPFLIRPSIRVCVCLTTLLFIHDNSKNPAAISSIILWALSGLLAGMSLHLGPVACSIRGYAFEFSKKKRL